MVGEDFYKAKLGNLSDIADLSELKALRLPDPSASGKVNIKTSMQTVKI